MRIDIVEYRIHRSCQLLTQEAELTQVRGQHHLVGGAIALLCHVPHNLENHRGFPFILLADRAALIAAVRYLRSSQFRITVIDEDDSATNTLHSSATECARSIDKVFICHAADQG